ncbi:hypothetical protein ACFU6M_00145 [Streptomyces bottropensis]|uniref:hypothetical protein n=1 Tax=Streptomyces bottropensis TaxID=42235 RepID=UPI0036ABD5E6
MSARLREHAGIASISRPAPVLAGHGLTFQQSVALRPGVEQVQGKPPPPGRARVAGYVTLIGADTANFDAGGMPTLQFVPSKDEPPGCA